MRSVVNHDAAAGPARSAGAGAFIRWPAAMLVFATSTPERTPSLVHRWVRDDIPVEAADALAKAVAPRIGSEVTVGPVTCDALPDWHVWVQPVLPSNGQQGYRVVVVARDSAEGWREEGPDLRK